MEYTQQQVRQVIGVGQETFRYWKRSLPPLMHKSGKKALFSAGEMLALSIVNQLVQTYRMDVSVVASIADALFDVCSRPLLFSRRPTMVVIDLHARSLAVVSDQKDMPVDRICLIVPVTNLWQQIGESFTRTDRIGDQRELLPLASVG